MKLNERLDRLLENNQYWSQTLGRYIQPPRNDEVKCPECDAPQAREKLGKWTCKRCGYIWRHIGAFICESANLTDKIMSYEDGEMEPKEIVDLFAELVKSGMAWQLQGHYGRVADSLIKRGLIDRQGKVLKYEDG